MWIHVIMTSVKKKKLSISDVTLFDSTEKEGKEMLVLVKAWLGNENDLRDSDVHPKFIEMK